METDWRIGDRCIYRQPAGTNVKAMILSIRERSASMQCGDNPPPAQPAGRQTLVFTLQLVGGGVARCECCGEGELARPLAGR
jgi:hypothetical protein